jgi:hypothetical protein
VDSAVTAGTTYCYRVRAYNSAGDSAYSNEACAAPAGATRYTVTVGKAGTGNGTVTSTPGGIACGSTCSADFDHGTNLTLTASAATGSNFTAWSGGGCSGTGSCTLPVSAATTVTATFTLSAYALTVAKAGTGSGAVTSSPSGISCGSDCTENYNYNTTVTLTAVPATDATFTGWSGACSGSSATCQVTMNQARNVTATFAAAVAPLTVTSFTADKTGPQPVGTAITFTVTGSGGVAPYQYKWWVWNGSAWSLGRDWGTGNTFTWTPTAAGSYFIHVWVRSNGTVADAAEAYNGLWTTIVP